MKKLKYFESFETRLIKESTENKRLSVEEIEDYFIDFLDSGQMSANAEDDGFFRKNEIIPYVVNGVHQPKIGTQFIINQDLNEVKNRDDLARYSNLFNKILEVCDRWKLDVSFSQFTKVYMTILQEVPQPITDILMNQASMSPADAPTNVIQIVVGGKTLRYFREVSIDDNNDFYIIFANVTIGRGGASFDKKRVREYDDLEDSVIEYFETKFPVPLQFSEIVGKLKSTNNIFILKNICPDYASYPKMLKFKILL